MSKELTVSNEKKYLTESVDLGAIFADEMDGLTPSFERIKIPAGGGVAFEVPGDALDSPDTVKEFEAVILYHQPINTYYKNKYDGSNNPPDCGSMDGKLGLSSEGELVECASCPFSKFESAEDGKGKACKQKRRLFLLREGEFLPIILTLPTGSLGEYSKYIMRVMGKGKKSNAIVTKFSLKKAQNSGGITYSQAVFSIVRELSTEECLSIEKMSEQVKAMATKVAVADEAE
jgi:hypothetical protein